MGFFDGLGQTLKQATGDALQAGSNSIGDYFSATAQAALVSVGIAPSGNLTPSEIAAGKTGSPPQPAVIPTQNTLAAIANAAGSPMVFMQNNKQILLIAGGVLAAYLILKKKRR